MEGCKMELVKNREPSKEKKTGWDRDERTYFKMYRQTRRMNTSRHGEKRRWNERKIER